MRKLFSLSFLLVSAALSAQTLDSWVTLPDSRTILQKGESVSFVNAPEGRNAPIVVDPRQQFQQMEGFGYSLTGGSAEMLMKMSKDARHKVLTELFSKDRDDISFIRLTIGASDMNSEVFSYDDIKEGETDWDLKHFSLANDLKDVVPVMQEIISINPDIAIMASPWSAPTWMKEEFDVRGPKLRKQCYDVYARYFVKYVQEMGKKGIKIGAVTIQNEPLNNRNTPSMPWDPQDQTEFIRDFLGPKFAEAGITTRIMLFDHNCDRPDYPLSILSDPEAAKYVCGTAFHQYMGDPTAMSQVHSARPDKDIFFTEQMIVDKSGGITEQIAFTVKRMLIDIPRNWSKSVILWNLAADKEAGPHTGNGGCPFCFGAITIDGDSIKHNIAYYTVMHASRFVPAGSYRIASTDTYDSAIMLSDDEQHAGVIRVNEYEHSGVLPNVAFSTPDGKIVLIVANTTGADVTFNIQYNGKYAPQTLKRGSVGTYVW